MLNTKSSITAISLFALASILITSMITTINPASAACDCVIFRLDDIQDYYLNTQQNAVMDKFIQRNENVTLGVILNFAGNDQSVISKVIAGHQSGNFEVATHGWNHDDYSTLSAQTQKDTLQLAKNKMQTLFGINSTIFIMPYNTFNANTQQAMKDLGYNIISAEFSQEIPEDLSDVYKDDGSNHKDSFGIYHLPQAIEFYNVTSVPPTKTPLSTILSTVNSTINQYGYAVITMHPSDFSNLSGGVPTGVTNATEIASLDTLITALKNPPYSFTIGSFSTATHVAPLPVIDNAPPTITPPLDTTVVSSQTLTVVSIGTAIATDVLDPSPIITNNATAQISNGFPQGITRVNWIATDHSGNSASAIQFVTVGPTADVTFPTIAITKPTNGQTIQGTSLGYNLRINGTTSEFQTVPTSGVKRVLVNTDQTPNAAATSTSGNFTTWTYILHVEPGNPPSPVTSIDAYSFDFWNNTGYLSPGPITGLTINLTGLDTTKPELIPPPNITINATGPLTPVSLGTPKVYDNADLNPIVSNNIGPGESSGFPPGTTLVTWSATDHATPTPNTSTATQSITIFNLTPAITSVTPASGSFINGAFLANYTLSEVVGSGNFTFTHTGGAADGAPHFYNFTTDNKSQGSHSVNSTARTTGGFGSLVNGAIYTMKVSAKDVLTGVSTSTSNTSITFDSVAPVITSVTPASGASVGGLLSANYTLNEAVPLGSITFARTAGTADSLTHFYNFTTGDKAAGPHSISRSVLETGFGNSLVGGANYTMTVLAKDLATNISTVSTTSISYDTTAPTITSVTPAASSTVNGGFSAGYTLSDPVVSGIINFTRTGGAADPLSSHIYNFAIGDTTAGPHSIARSVLETGFGNSLVSGAIYTMKVSATDVALNVATPVSNTLIIYDNTPPSITSLIPPSSTSVNAFFKANYTLGESITTGSIAFTRTGGAADALSPHTYVFGGSGYLTSGVHSIPKATLETLFGSPLINGAVYNMTVSATDAVSNLATATNTLITYDTTPPVISSVVPESSSSVNQFNVAYTLNEAASSGTITFTHTGGTADVATHIYNLATADKTAGPHSISKTTLQTGFGNSLVNGAVYTMTISATDMATNVATPVTKTVLAYSSTIPICPVPGNPWVITSGCKITGTVTPLGNVDVQNGAVVTIESGGILDIDSLTKHLKIHFGSGILVKSGGKIK